MNSSRSDLSMLTDHEVRTKLFELVKLLGAAGIFTSKGGGNPSDALSKVLGLLLPPAEKSSPKADFTYDATKEEKKEAGWTEKVKELFK